MQRQTALTWLWVSAWWLLTGLVWTGQMYEAFSGQVATSYLLRTEMAKAVLWTRAVHATRHRHGRGHKIA